jgi:hypothetical protein
MTDRACVAIGISRYQLLQPLNYGQADAQAVQRFLVSQTDLSSGQCLLLTDNSPQVDNYSTHPTRAAILHWLDTLRRETRPSEGWRWFFFSGYGVSWREDDYLMPIDGDPNDIPGTGIPVQSFFNALKARGNEKVLALLDINRSPGLQAGAPVGAQTVELAEQMDIALMLSSQLNQYSHEAAALGNGLFTAALLEALYYYRTEINLDNLFEYLEVRLPELSQHHWRPIQNPLAIAPSETLKQQLILPFAVNTSGNGKSFGTPAPELEVEKSTVEQSPNGTGKMAQKTAVSALETRQNPPLMPNPTAALELRKSDSTAMIHNANGYSESEAGEAPWWREWLFWIGGAVLVVALIGVTILRNRDGLQTQQAIEPATTQTPGSPVPEPAETGMGEETATEALAPGSERSEAATQTPNSERLQANQATLAQAKRLIQPNQASLFSRAIAQARQIQPGDPLYEQAQRDIARWSQVILDLAEGRAKQGNFSGAIAAAKLVPGDNQQAYQEAQQKIQQWQNLATQQQRSREIIQTAQQQIQPNQASSYNQAIGTLRRIQPGQPGYAEAQELINQWSRQIYLIANSRAAQGNFQGATQTAALVPQGTPSYQNAQNAIARWQQQGQQQQAQSQIQTAREQIQPNQASSYNRAINTLRQIKSGQSGYEQAQELIDQWSRQIYLIANSRAAQGNFQAAVQTAELVPQDTPSHQNAQKAIAKWKQGQR